MQKRADTKLHLALCELWPRDVCCADDIPSKCGALTKTHTTSTVAVLEKELANSIFWASFLCDCDWNESYFCKCMCT